MQNKIILIIGGTGALGKTLVNRYYNNNKIVTLLNYNQEGIFYRNYQKSQSN